MVFWRVIIYVASAQVSLTAIHYRNDVTDGHVTPRVQLSLYIKCVNLQVSLLICYLTISTTPYQ